MLRTLIVDDEQPARDELAYLLASHEDIDLCEASSVDEALEVLAVKPIDLVLLDIQMPGRNGFDLLREIACEPQPPFVVLVTAFDQHAVRAFEENAVDYLLKPVAPERLARALDRVRKLAADRAQARESRTMQNLLARLGQPCLPRLAVERGGKICLLHTAHVVLVEADGKKVTALTDDGVHACHGLPTLAKAEERLAGQPFFRANRSVLINLERIAEFSPWQGGRYIVIMNDHARTEVVVSRNQVRDFKLQLGV